MANAASGSAADPPGYDAAIALRDAADRVRTVESRIESVGEADLVAVADAVREAHRLLDRYEKGATGTGDFGAYVAFRDEFVGLVESLDESLPAYDAFERAGERMDKRRLNESDFAFARETLSAADEHAELLDERADAREAYQRARHSANERREELRTERDRLEGIRAMGSVDPDIDLDRLRNPIDTYNDAVSEAFDRHLRQQSAREVFSLLATAEHYPLVDVPQPPADLVEYVERYDAGEEPIPTLLEYADYSPSKLDHYVAAPDALRRTVAVHRTALDRISAAPFRLDWPPAPATVVRYRLRELASLTRRFDDPPDDEPPLETHLRRLRALARRPDYDALRQAAVADARLTADEFDRVRSGAIDDDIAAVQEGIEAMTRALEETADIRS
ncbi:DUF7118 family protein [Haloferacaceae archaeon DSL9]